MEKEETHPAGAILRCCVCSVSDHNNETKKSVGILDYRYTARTLGETHVSTDELTKLNC